MSPGPQSPSSTRSVHNVLIVGNGGREHCLAWKLAFSDSVDKIYVHPGNGGTNCNINGKEIKNAKITVNEKNKEEHLYIYEFCKSNDVYMVVVGPELPLCEGIRDNIEKHNKTHNTSLKVFGPSRLAAELEGSKKYSKQFMTRHRIPTAEYQVFNNKENALAYVNTAWKDGSHELVIKASGLAGGKGVYVCNTKEDAVQAVVECLENKVFGNSGMDIVIEQKLKGVEISVLALCDGDRGILLPSSTDYKRRDDNDKGPNTGGMGAMSPSIYSSDAIMSAVYTSVLEPTLKGMKAEGREFIGCLYMGIMVCDDGCKVLEYNVRFGDPETQAVLPILDLDLFHLFDVCVNRQMAAFLSSHNQILPCKKAAVTVVMASGGYPKTFETGLEILGLQDGKCHTEKDSAVFHAGTRLEGSQLFTSGGRVLAVTGVCDTPTGDRKKDIADAREKAYAKLKQISFKSSFYRNDIALLH